MPHPVCMRRDSDVTLEVPEDSASSLLERIYRQHAQLVLDTAYRLTGSTPDAEDVLQDVFLGLPAALERYDERSAFPAWLRRVTVRVALMKLRRERGLREVAMDSVPEPHVSGGDHTPERMLLQHAIASLPDPLRVVFILREVEGFSHAEIAAELGIREGTSQIRHFRAIRHLRAALQEHL